ncbi:hypothetical protein [Clostridium grantii]|uniref:Uncharacterized protein n=1 Tax=Clostridium grantii DSM 8605 TaxID=1121316 RepID=A0A1M5WC95_9CLOT|nr:hypothetical protein [Clostridium grantii]SHH84833.1 hypothetical protein SAMN02745207_02796 [Clostridium grantii DSM 8605]
MDMSQIGNMVSMLNSMGGVDFNNLLKSSGLGDKAGGEGCDTNRTNSSSLILIILIVLLCCWKKRGLGFGTGCGNNYNNNCLDDCCCLCKKKDRKHCEKLKKKIRKAKCQCCGQNECCERDNCCGGSYGNNSCGLGGFGGFGNCFGNQGSGIIVWIIFAILILKKLNCGANGLNSIFESLGDKDECDNCLD